MKKIKEIALKIVKNKYLLATTIFLFIIIFIDDDNLRKRFSNTVEIKRLNSEIEQYKEEYKEATRKLEDLERSREGIEKIARERYFMKKDNEDIFVFED
ncbi:MAG: septum formation initiator family protein [Bacteroides sp.]|nr:septum formation initiator family protein [Bacteroides sp.]